jgi:hypothetical protein
LDSSLISSASIRHHPRLMTDASPSAAVRRVLLLTLAATATATIPGAAGTLARHVLLQAAAAAALFCTFFAGRARGVGRTAWPLLALVVPAVVSTAFSVDPMRSFVGSPFAGGGLVGTLAVAGLALAIALRADDALPQVRLVLAGLTVALTAGVVAQRFGWNPLAARFTPSAGDGRAALPTASGVGAFLALATPLVHAGAFDETERPSRRKWYAVVPTIAFVGVMAADVRGPLVALAAGMWALALFRATSARRHRQAKILLAAGAAGILICLSLIPGGPGSPGLLLHPFTEAGLGRDELDAEGARAIFEAPLARKAAGYGLETTRFIAPRRTPEQGLKNDELDDAYERTRSLMHETLITQGWLGLLGFTVFLAFVVVRGPRRSGVLRLGPPATLAAYVVLRLFSATTPETELLFATAAGFLLRPSKARAPRDTASAGPVRVDVTVIAVAGMVVGAAGTLIATGATGAICLMVWGAAFLVAVVGKPEPLRVAAAAATLIVFLAWRPELVRVAARDDVRTAEAAAAVFGGFDAGRVARERYVAEVAAEDGARGFELAAAAVVARDLKMPERAGELAERAARREPRDGAAKALSARLFAAQVANGGGTPAAFVEASDRLERAIAVWDDDAGLRLELIRVRMAAGDREGARRALSDFERTFDLLGRRRDKGLMERFSADLATARAEVGP